MVRTKKIDGLLYIWEDEFGRKKDAQKEAKSFRDRGYKARVIKIKGGYDLYSYRRR